MIISGTRSPGNRLQTVAEMSNHVILFVVSGTHGIMTWFLYYKTHLHLHLDLLFFDLDVFRLLHMQLGPRGGSEEAHRGPRRGLLDIPASLV